MYISLSKSPQWYVWSATLKNFKPKANSTKPKTTLTEFNHPPDFGNLLSQEGKKLATDAFDDVVKINMEVLSKLKESEQVTLENILKKLLMELA